MGSACSDRMLPQPLTIATSRRTDFEVEAHSINVTALDCVLALTVLTLGCRVALDHRPRPAAGVHARVSFHFSRAPFPLPSSCIQGQYAYNTQPLCAVRLSQCRPLLPDMSGLQTPFSGWTLPLALTALAGIYRPAVVLQHADNLNDFDAIAHIMSVFGARRYRRRR